MNRVILTIVASLMLVLAGCVGSPGGSPFGADQQDGSSDGPADSADDVSSGTGSDGSGGGSGDAAEFEMFDFSQPGRYEYEIYTADEGEGTVVWDVQSVDGETVTVFIDYELGDSAYESTVTGTREDIQSQMMMSPAGAFVMMGMFSPYYGYYEGRELRVGNQWSYSAGGESMSFAVTGTDTVGGVDCYTSEIRINEDIFHEACFSPDRGLAPYTAYYQDDGELSFSMELVSYEAR